MIFNGALPAFDFTGSDIALTAARGLFVAALFSGYGSLAFVAWVMPRPADRNLPGLGDSALSPLRRLTMLSLAAALVLALVWLALETAGLANAPGLGAALAAGPDVLTGTLFGRVISLQLLAIVASLLAVVGGGRTSYRFALGFAAVATVLQAGHGHALAMEKGPSLLLFSEVLHLLCAGAWLGSLAPLFLFVRLSDGPLAARAAHNFSPLGKLCVSGLLVSAIFQGWILIGGLPGLIGSAYGWVAMAKIVLLAIMLVFAAANRYRLTPALDAGRSPDAKGLLLRSIGLETCVGAVLVFAASTLTSLPPALHVQPVWPFTVQPSLVTIDEDPAFKAEVLKAIAMLAAAALLVLAAILARRIRWPAIAGAAILAWIAVPHLSLLFVEASPTSFYQSPTGFAATSINAGATLYAANCVACHGPEGKGDGPLAKDLAIPPADLTALHLWAHSDGELFWWLTHGIDNPEGGLAMPGFADTLDEDQRWNLIDFMRARNGGLSYARAGAWPLAIQAPGFQAHCPDGLTFSSEDLRGKIVLLAFVGDEAESLPASTGQGGVQVVTIKAPAQIDVHLSEGSGCRVGDTGLGRAYATVVGASADAMEGRRFLIDPNGWLRASWRAVRSEDASAEKASARNLDAPALFQAEIARIIDNPIEHASTGHHHH